MHSFESNDGTLFKIDNNAIEHISVGEYSDNHGRKVIKGGLHCVEGLVKLLLDNPDITDLLSYDCSKHSDWYFIRELCCGAFLVRLPRALFSGKAANATMNPDNHYKSGYLWKTIFPPSVKRSDIPDIVQYVVNNGTKKDNHKRAQSGSIIGCASINGALVRIEVLYENDIIKSAYPTWTQPTDEKNGKPFTHIDSIRFPISQSYMCSDGNSITAPKNFSITLPSQRPAVLNKKENIKIALSGSELEQVQNYVTTFPKLKFSAHIDIERKKRGMPSVFSDIISALHLFIESKAEKNAESIIHAVMSNLVVHTGYNEIEAKRLATHIMITVLSTFDSEGKCRFIKHLNNSPLKYYFYADFGLEGAIKQRHIKNCPLDDVPKDFDVVNTTLLDDYIVVDNEDKSRLLAQLLPETHLLRLDHEERKALQKDKFSLVENSLSVLKSGDFKPFYWLFEILLKDTRFKGSDDIESDLISIANDFIKLKQSERSRLHSIYKGYYAKTKEFYTPVDAPLVYGYALKHELYLNQMQVDGMISSLKKLSGKNNFKRLPQKLDKLEKRFKTNIPVKHVIKPMLQ
tara:strand:+ start:1796 stop:3514 length:1719 start_codon:yes stop_codon:yes gene_type:complete